MTFAPAMFGVAMCDCIGIMHFQEITLFDFDLDLGIKVTRNVAQEPLHHETFASAKLDFGSCYVQWFKFLCPSV